MNPEVRIRLATKADSDLIGYHRARMFQDMGQIPAALFETFQQKCTSGLTDLFRRREYVGWLASPGDQPEKIIAGAGVQLRRVLPHPLGEHRFAEGRHALILNVFTEPDWRRRGVADLLLKTIIDWSQHNKFDRLVLHASVHGRALYQRLGFVPTNEMKFVGDVLSR